METRDIRYEEEYRLLRKSKRKLKKENLRLRRINFIFGTVIMVLLGIICVGTASMTATNRALSAELVSTKEKLSVADELNLDLINNFNSLSKEYANISKILVSVDNQNKKLVDNINSLNSTLTSYEEREELFDDYEYAIIREDGTRTDISYSDINNLKSVAKSLNMTDDSIDLILSLAMTETRGIEDAKNKKSSALGLGQILNDTGTFVWTKLMNNENYNHKKIASNSTNNLEMMAYYIDYLNKKYHGNARSIVKEYRGENDKQYFKMVDSYLSKNDLSLSTLKISEETK